MKIYFGKAEYNDVDLFGDDGMFAVTRNGETQWFYQGVEHGTNAGGLDEVRIFDGCERSIPISIDQIPELVEALNYCYNNYQSINRGSELAERLETNDEVFVGNDDGYLFVQDGE